MSSEGKVKYQMTTSLKGKDYIETQDLSLDEINLLLETSDELKAKFHRGEPTVVLNNQTAYLLFFDKSTRTRNAFEAGMTQLGGHAPLPGRRRHADQPTAKPPPTPARSSPPWATASVSATT